MVARLLLSEKSFQIKYLSIYSGLNKPIVLMRFEYLSIFNIFLDYAVNILFVGWKNNIRTLDFRILT